MQEKNVDIFSKDKVAERTIQAISNVLIFNKGLKKNQLAKELGLKQPKLSEILCGRVRPNTEVMSRLCSKYGISGDWILYGKGEMVTINRGDSDQCIDEHPFPEKKEILDRLEFILMKDGSSIDKYEKEHKLFSGTFNNARKRGTMRIVSDWAFSILQEHPLYSMDWVFFGDGECLRKNRQHILQRNNSPEDTKDLLGIIAEKDSIIERKDLIISKKDDTITKLTDRLTDLLNCKKL